MTGMLSASDIDYDRMTWIDPSLHKKVLSVSKLSKSYNSTRNVLNEVTFDLYRGELVGVIGRSGAGKSTLLHTLNGTHRITSGEIIKYPEDDKPHNVSILKGQELNHWRAECGMVFQDYCLVPRLDVITNVLLGRLSYTSKIASFFKVFSKEDRARAIALLEWIGLLPQALQRVEHLSGGQMQRVAICRALMQDPSILLADEPVASLDPKNTERIMDLLAEIGKQGICVVVNLHSVKLVQEYCTRVIGLSQGRVIFNGSPSQLTEEILNQLYEDEPQENHLGNPAALN